MKNTVKLTLHNGSSVLVNWDTVAFATPSISETTRETFTKLVFSASSAHEVDVKETLEEVNAILLNVGNDKKLVAATTKAATKTIAKRKSK